MATMLEGLSEETRTRLRALAARAEAVEWPSHVAAAEGAAAANREYHARQSQQGADEMIQLLTALGLEPPLPPEQVKDVLLTAIALFLHTDGVEATARPAGDVIVLNVSRCPIYERFTDPTWRGVTACGCFSRRQGWYDALGVPRDEELVLNRKWDDPICETAVHLPIPVAAV
jgi:hypothetical protein